MGQLGDFRFIIGVGWKGGRVRGEKEGCKRFKAGCLGK